MWSKDSDEKFVSSWRNTETDMETLVNMNGGNAEVCVKGRLSTDEAAGFLKAIEPLMNESGIRVVMDLGGLEFISSAGIRGFIMLLKACQSKGSTLVLKNLTPQIESIFRLTALLDKFQIE